MVNDGDMLLCLFGQMFDFKPPFPDTPFPKSGIVFITHNCHFCNIKLDVKSIKLEVNEIFMMGSWNRQSDKPGLSNLSR